jgi:pyruvate/2-oxoglutarate dehydrogenase complex dihydrolipoamide dehydrogenase (E3) component
MDIRRADLTMGQWRQLIDDAYRGKVTWPIMNIDESRGSHYDAIFLSGGAAVLRSLGGRALVLDRWPFLGGSCPHQACVPHHLFSEAAKELDQAHALAGWLWYGKFDPDAASILELVELFRTQRSGPHAHMNWQGTQQLDIEYILNAPARDIPDFLHTTYEVSWAGLSEREARQTAGHVVTIQLPRPDLAPGETPLPMAEGSMIYGFTMLERTGFQKCVIDARSRRVLGVHHAGYGAKDAFQYLHHLISRPGGLTIDEPGNMNELYLSPDYFIGYARLRSGQADLTSI